MISGDNGEGPGNRSVEEIVSNAIGDSVTPSRLLKSNKTDFIERLIGRQDVDGPFTTHLKEDEQPHYLFHSDPGLEFPEEEDEFNDDRRAVFGNVTVSPAVLLITDQRVSFIYGQENRRIISIDHSDIVDIDFANLMIGKRVRLHTTDRGFMYQMRITEKYSSEMSDAVAYLFDKADTDEEYQEYDFSSKDYQEAGEALKDQLRNIAGLVDQLDISYVARYAVSGARIGRYGGPKTSFLAFVLAGGYAIWDDLSQGANSGDMADDVDPEETAEEIVKWQQMSGGSSNSGMQLARGALGAAVAIDKQTSGEDIIPLFENLDAELVARQLIEGEAREAGLQVTSAAVETYSTNLAKLLNDGFFEELQSNNR